MSAYKDVLKLDRELVQIRLDLSLLTCDYLKAQNSANGQYASDQAAGLFGQISFAAQIYMDESGALKEQMSKKEMEEETKEEELKSAIYFYCSDMLVTAEYNSVTLGEYLNKYSLVSEWNEVQSICCKVFGDSVFWELCRK